MASECHAVGLQHFPMHQVVRRVADENRVLKLRAKQLIAIGNGTARRGDLICVARLVVARQHRACGENPAPIRIVGGVVLQAGHEQLRIPAQIMQGQEIMPEEGDVVVAKPVSPVITMPAVLGATGFQLEGPAIRLESQVAFPHGYWLVFWRGSDCPATVAVSRVYPIVQAILEPIHAMLRISRVKSRQNRLMNIRFAIAIAGLGIIDFAPGADHDAFAPGINTVWVIQTVEKHRRFIVNALMVAVFDKDNSAIVSDANSSHGKRWSRSRLSILIGTISLR